MHNLDEIAEKIHHSFDTRTKARDELLNQARTLTRHCANAIRAIHRESVEEAQQHLSEARSLMNRMRQIETVYPDLFYAGYTQDSFKEFAEANLTVAFIQNTPLPSPEDLGLEYATYLQGLAEAAGELRRRCLDLLLKENPAEARRMLSIMDDIYAVLVTMDYPDAITGGLRRLTDLARGIIERTRGDLTLSLRQEHLEKSLLAFEERLKNA